MEKRGQLGKPPTIMICLLIAWVLVFVLLHRTIGSAIFILYVVVAATAGWLMGIRGGLLFGLLGILINIILLYLAEPGWNAEVWSVTFWLSQGIVIYAGGIVGRISNMNEQTKREFAEHKQMETALRESEEKYRNLVERANDGVAIIQDRLIKYANNRLAEMTGYTVEETVNTPFTNYVHPDALPKVANHYRRRMAGEKIPSIYEAVLRTKENTRIDIELNAGIITYQRKPADLVLIRDITDRKKIEAEKLKAMGNAARSIAHDIRNPLQAMRTATYILRDAEGGKRRTMTDLVDRNIVVADRIIQNLMDFTETPPLKLKGEDVNRLLQRILTETLLPANVKLTTRYGDIPHTKVDSGQLSRVFQNLTVNAVQAMPKGGELTISTRQVGDLIEVKVKDTGIGIPKENLGKLFGPFFTTKAKGTGLGLANAKQVVEAHRGTITVESEEGRGTTVTVRLPITPAKKTG